MTPRERIADWITGGALTRERERADYCRDMLHHEQNKLQHEADLAAVSHRKACDEARAAMRARKDAANIAAQRDEAIARAEVAEKALGAVTIALEAAQGEAAFADQSRAFEVEDAMALKTALRAILTARNITEARKIAKQALGEGE